MDGEQRNSPFYPLPTQFLQPEASEDEEDDLRYADDDEYDHTLMQIKVNSRAAANDDLIPPDGSGISPNVFYGVAETSHQVVVIPEYLVFFFFFDVFFLH